MLSNQALCKRLGCICIASGNLSFDAWSLNVLHEMTKNNFNVTVHQYADYDLGLSLLVYVAAV